MRWAVVRDEDVVLDPDAEAEVTGGDPLLVRPHVEAGLDREDHPGFEPARLSAVLDVPAAVVHVEAQPVRRVVEAELLSRVRRLQAGPAAFQEAEIEKAVEEHLARGGVRSVEARARFHVRERRLLGRENHGIEPFLRPREAARSREGARHVGGVSPVLASRIHEDEIAV